MHAPTDRPLTLIRMANDIGKFFRIQGEERAVAGIADHIKKFWEPRMKRQIFAYLDTGGAGLDPLPLKAIEKLKAETNGAATAAEAGAALEAEAQKPPFAQPTQQPKANAAGNGKRARR